MRKLALTTTVAALLGAAGQLAEAQADNYTEAKDATKRVFGYYSDQAMRVVRCETGGTYSVYAHNGQYLGLFQMGSNERATYGHGYTALAQAKAAYRYFVDSGRDWSPWSCKP